MAFIDLFLLAAVAVFLGYRVWLVLGTHDADKPIRKRQPKEEDVVIPGRARQAAQPSADVVQETEAPATMDDDRFLQGATTAFREIVGAYAEGNVAKLKKLLEGPLLETFEDAIAKRKKAKTTLEVDIARVVSAEILDKREEKNESFITVRFVSEQCLITRNTRGKIVQGDPDQFSEVTDIWTFSHPIKSKNPNWKLVATQLPEG